MTKRLDDSWTKWSEPKNLGKPLNSEGIDAYYSVPADGEYAYFVSSVNTNGENDIFKIKLPSQIKPEPVVIIKGYVLNSKTKEPLNTKIQYEDLETGQIMGFAQTNPKTGFYEITLPLNKKYAFFADKEGFYSVRDNLDLTEVQSFQEVERDLYLTPIEVGQTVQLNNVFFNQGKATLLSSSYPELDKLARMLKDNPNIEIQLEGHTDNVGDPDLNLKLSEERVIAVKSYLVLNGVSELRITGRGYGGEKPIASNDQEFTRRLNRRVEFKILKY
jgi:outer membrane protein OmpA-like peptidoglycan-associated protein